MEQQARRLADILLDAHPIARLGLSAPDPRCRERAAGGLAAFILARLEREERALDERQMALPIV